MDKFSPLAWKKSEIIFVIGVLVVLFGISFFQLRIGQQKTRDSQRKADVELVGRALDEYLVDHKTLPAASADGKMIACGNDGTEVCDWGAGPVIDAEGVVYLKVIPVDPFAFKNQTYIYEVDAARKKYTLYITLEYKRDVSLKKNLTRQCGPGLQCNWYVKN